MSVVTHDTQWRLLVGAAPVVGAAFFVWAAAQGEGEVARSPMARAILAGVAALGTLVAWWTARQLRAAPAISVGRASELARAGMLTGPVAIRGRARPLPDAVPLISPDGELCLWFGSGPHGASHDSVRPFLVQDDSGDCIVLPVGADVTGSGPVPPPAGRPPAGARPGERLLRNGDRIHVVGRFVPASPEALGLQAEAALLAARTETPRAVLRSGDPSPLRDMRSAARAGAAFVAAPPLVPHGIALPVVTAPGASQPFVIRIGSDEGEGGVYGLLAVVDSLVLAVSSSLVAWPLFVPG